MAFKFVKKNDAPEGPIKIGLGTATITVTDDKPYETDDIRLVESVRTLSSRYIEVVAEDEKSPAQAAKAEAAALKKLSREQEKAQKQRAEKDPTERPADIPTSVDQLDDAKGDK